MLALLLIICNLQAMKTYCISFVFKKKMYITCVQCKLTLKNFIMYLLYLLVVDFLFYLKCGSMHDEKEKINSDFRSFGVKKGSVARPKGLHNSITQREREI